MGRANTHLCNEFSNHEKEENSLWLEKEFIISIKRAKLLPKRDICLVYG